MKLEHNPGAYSTDIDVKDVTERALQRAIIDLKSAILDKVTVSWIDIELPTKEGNSPRFDLIGETDDDCYALCEIKFAKGTSHGDDPQKTVSEQLIPYKDSILDYAQRLKTANLSFNLHSNAASQHLDIDKLLYRPVKLVLAANKEYWSHHHHRQKNPAIEYYSINIESDWFFNKSRTASDSNGKYIPSMPPFTRHWTPVR